MAQQRIRIHRRRFLALALRQRPPHQGVDDLSILLAVQEIILSFGFGWVGVIGKHCVYGCVYPLVNIQKAMENGHL